MSKLKNLNLLATVALILGACAPAATPAPVVVLPTQGPKPTVAVVIVPSNTPKPTPVPALPVEIVYWDHFDASIQKEALAQTEAYNGLQTAVKVLEQGFPAEFSLPVWVDPKTGPDIASLGTGQVWDLSSQGALVALDTRLDFKEATSNIPADILKSLTADDGHVYAIPYVGSAVMMAYNKKLFAEAGISAPPATWSEALVACKKLSNKAKGQFGWTFGNWGLYGGDWWMPLFHFDDYYMNAAGDRAWVTKTGDVHLTDTPASEDYPRVLQGDWGCRMHSARNRSGFPGSVLSKVRLEWPTCFQFLQADSTKLSMVLRHFQYLIPWLVPMRIRTQDLAPLLFSRGLNTRPRRLIFLHG